MKKILLLATAALVVTSAHAQLRHSDATVAPPRPQVQAIKPQAKMEEAQMRTPGTPVVKAPKRTDEVKIWYNRPAGAYPASIIVEDGAYAGMMYFPYLSIKPYVDYTFVGQAVGVSDNATFEWDVHHWDITDGFDSEQIWSTIPGEILKWHWGYETDDAPILYVIDGGDCYDWQYGIRKKNDNNSGSPVVTDEMEPAKMLSVPSTIDIWNCDLLKSSKTFSFYTPEGDYLYPMTYYSGPEPYGDNEKGWWFGKNGGTTDSSGHTCRIDGIAQAFEKPTAPYMLNQVVVDCAVLQVTSPVDMTCKIYKLDKIPPYLDDDMATLPDEPGELIAKGRAHVTPETDETTGGLIFFTLYDVEDGLEYDITPTIDCAILVVIDGYNEPEMAGLRDFSALICSDIHVDEGFGELAYLKWGVTDDNGNLDHYEWCGLNNFFRSGEMKTGLSIFLTTENPYLTFSSSDEDGQYLFPEEGGRLNKSLIDPNSPSIQFLSWVPSADDDWVISCNGEEVPDWLTITLEDQMEDGEFTGVVNAEVYAEPLPPGERFRKAVVRFEFPGAYLDYTFKQSENPKPPVTKYDLNDDGIVNIIDVNLLIVWILEDKVDANMSDINAMIAIILGDNPHPIWRP